MISLLLLLLVPTQALPHVVMEGGSKVIPDKWNTLLSTARGQTIELTFAVKQQNLEQLHDTLMRVSKPSSPDYGMHLSNDEVQTLTAPKPEHIEAVYAFLRKHGAEGRPATPNSDMIHARVPVETAETMLQTSYVTLLHKETGTVVERAPGGYSLPGEVAAVVDFVSPTVHIPGVRRPKVEKVSDDPPVPTVPPTNTSNGTLPNIFNTPHNLRKLYSIGPLTFGRAKGNKHAVTAFLEQTYSDAGLLAYWGLFCLNATPPLLCGKGLPKMVGDKNATRAPVGGIESMLDIETITGVAGNIDSEFWGFAGRTPDNPENEPFMKWLSTLSSTNDTDVPKIFSTSYGEDENSWSFPAAQRLNVEFQKAGVRGISLLYASGDEGANCKGGKYVPEGPGSSPYVTSVGGTMPGLKGLSHWPNPGGEWAIPLSSGGFSNYWKMPEWQKDAVTKYLNTTSMPDPKKQGYNASGRAYPDIAAQATMFVVVSPLPLPGVSGTSCASPTAAGVFSLLNDLRMQKGKSTLGFLNPFIYENTAAFHDITFGAQSGCPGWPVKKGWDAVTGVGTPNYKKLAKAVLNLPSGKALGQSASKLIV